MLMWALTWGLLTLESAHLGDYECHHLRTYIAYIVYHYDDMPTHLVDQNSRHLATPSPSNALVVLSALCFLKQAQARILPGENKLAACQPRPQCCLAQTEPACAMCPRVKIRPSLTAICEPEWTIGQAQRKAAGS